MYAKWALAPSGYYIGVVEFNNKHYYASGRTADQLEKNIKRQMYIQEHVSNSQVHLEHQRSDEIDISFASRIFVGRYVKAKAGRPVVATKTKIITPPKPVLEHLTETIGDELVVYELREVARYKLHEVGTKNQNNNLPTPDPVVCPTAEESQVDFSQILTND